MSEISDYLLIGDLHTSALVSRNASIDWMCLPHFDSQSIFAKILDKNAGEFSIDTKGYKTDSEYIKNTAIVRTLFKNKNRSFEIRDFMVPQPRSKIHTHFLVRKIKNIHGKNSLIFYFKPKINYGKNNSKIIQTNCSLTILIGKEKLVLHLPKKSDVKIKKGNCVIKIDLKDKETKELILEHCEKRSGYYKNNLEKKTKKFWRNWVAKGTFFEFCIDKLIRSAITLKLMQFYPTGALIASPTTSLPEVIKGKMNWDYRYVWIRDAVFSLYAFYVLGYIDEAKRFFGFIEKISRKMERGKFDINSLYTIEGERVPEEKNLKYLSGYKNSKPVRIGNKATDQFQLDVYGTLIDAYYFMLKRGFKISNRKKKIILNLLRKIENRWKEKDSGMWESRENIKDYTHSKVTAWVGVNRVLRICDSLGISKKRKIELQNLEKEINYWIWENCFNYKNNKLLRYPKAKIQDSTNFLFVLLQFLDKRDPKTKKIVNKTMKELLINKAFVKRYKRNTKEKNREGSFVLSTFWLISALAILEEINEAEKLFEEFGKYICRGGLMSEEINSRNKDYLGNFPQSFSHMGYIMSAYYIDKYKKKLSKHKKEK